jgi:hypothetical protein
MPAGTLVNTSVENLAAVIAARMLTDPCTDINMSVDGLLREGIRVTGRDHAHLLNDEEE